jgi:hypothetical protein
VANNGVPSKMRQPSCSTTTLRTGTAASYPKPNRQHSRVRSQNRSHLPKQPIPCADINGYKRWKIQCERLVDHESRSRNDHRFAEDKIILDTMSIKFVLGTRVRKMKWRRDLHSCAILIFWRGVLTLFRRPLAHLQAGKSQQSRVSIGVSS